MIGQMIHDTREKLKKQKRLEKLLYPETNRFTMNHMLQRISYAIHVAVLALFSIFSMSPIYMSATSRGPVSCGDEDKDVAFGIVWVNVVLSSMIDADQGTPPDRLVVSSNEQDQDFILVKKKRAVLRHSSDLKPIIQISHIAQNNADDEIRPSALFCTVPLDLRHRLSDSPLYLHIGLSPPRSV